MSAFVQQHPTLVAWAFGLSLLMSLGGLLLIPLFVARMRDDYFVRSGPPLEGFRAEHPQLSLLLRVMRNLLGAFLFLAGLAMLVLPGQGLLTLFVALTLSDFPGKRRLEVALLRKRAVSRAIGWIRRRAGQPPLQLPPRAARTGD